MKRTVPISDIVAWPFLLPGNLACHTIGLARHSDLVPMFLSSVRLASGRYKRASDVIHPCTRAGSRWRVFERWFALWYETTFTEMLRGALAGLMQAEAQRIAETLKAPYKRGRPCTPTQLESGRPRPLSPDNPQ